MTGIDSHVPKYSLEEKSQEIIITIVAPLSKPKEGAFVLEKDVFIFDSPPYFLKIKLPHHVSDTSSDKAYDANTGTYKVKLHKKTADSKESSSDEDTDDDEILNCLPGGTTNPSDGKTEQKQFYGFANKYSKMFGKLYNEFSEIINLPNPDTTDVQERRKLRMAEEDEKWSDDHYLADTMETDHLESIFQYNPPWITSPVKDELNDDEKEMLSELFKKSKIGKLSKELQKLSEYQIVEIIFCYAYNKRTTEGDNTVESGWTINKLSSTLSWFEVFEDLKAVILSCYRRSLIYPLYRNWKLTEMVHRDVANILKLGSKQITRCLLEVIEIFNDSDNRYLLNTLYMNDLCNFGCHMTNKRAGELSEEVKKIKIKKFEVNTDLPLLEIAAHLTLEEEETEGSSETNVENIIEKIGDIKIGSEKESSTESDSSESDSEDSDSTQSSGCGEDGHVPLENSEPKDNNRAVVQRRTEL